MGKEKSVKLLVHPDYKVLKSFVERLPESFARGEGRCIYKGRNELRAFEEEGFQLVVKSYRRPNLFNRLVYSFIRSTKAERAYRNALMFIEAGIGSPAPVAFLVKKEGGLIDETYFVSLQSTCPFTFRDLTQQTFAREEEILTAIGQVTARIHNQGFLHKDYSRGNILFDDREAVIAVEIVDLNRMRFGSVSQKVGCRNLNRLPLPDGMFDVLGTAYAKARGFDPEVCIREIKAARKREAVRTNEPF